MKLPKKHLHHFKYLLTTILGFVGLSIVLIIGNIYYEKINPIASNIKYGVTFSNIYAEYLGLEWKTVYSDLLTNLSVKYLRIPAYWQEVEPIKNQFYFDDLDYMLDKAAGNNAQVVLAIGLKLPRWPECHAPEWILDLSDEERQNSTLHLLETLVTRYQNHPAIYAWQIENEPLLNFGSRLCNLPNREFLKQEVDLVKKLDPSHPIILTDSGELRMWITPMKLSDIMGTTLYRSVYNEVFGYFYYPLPPAFYNLKSNLVRKIFAPNNQKTIIVELQAEPWSPSGVPSFPIEEQIKVFPVKDLENNVNYAKRTGFDEIYLWGVEWWYYMDKHHHPEYLDYAKNLFD